MPKTHGMSQTKFYKIWKGIRNRCKNPNSTDYKFYGGRNIKLSKEWDRFENFYTDMFPSYKDGLTIERIDNNKGYVQGNCRWISRREQSYNRRSNVILSHNGQTKTVMEWSKIVGIKYDTLIKRITKTKWTTKQILTTPLLKIYK